MLVEASRLDELPCRGTANQVNEIWSDALWKFAKAGRLRQHARRARYLESAARRYNNSPSRRGAVIKYPG